MAPKTIFQVALSKSSGNPRNLGVKFFFLASIQTSFLNKIKTTQVLKNHEMYHVNLPITQAGNNAVSF